MSKKDFFVNIKQITLLGYYGRNNFGDDLMLASILKKLSNRDLIINLIAYEDIKWVKDDFKNVKSFIWPEGKLKKILFYLKAIKNSQVIIWGGGTCFTDEEGDGHFKYMILAKLLRKKIAYYGVGLGRLNKLARKIKTFLLINISDYISLRDDISYIRTKKTKILKRSFVFRTDDPALDIIMEESNKTITNQSKTLTISWRNLENYPTTIGNKNACYYVTQLCRDICSKKDINKIVIFDGDSYSDRKINTEIYNMLKNILKGENIEVTYDNAINFKTKIELIKSSSIVITSRLHVAIAAHFFGCKYYVYNYSPKIEYFLKENPSSNSLLIPINFNGVEND